MSSSMFYMLKEAVATLESSKTAATCSDRARLNHDYAFAKSKVAKALKKVQTLHFQLTCEDHDCFIAEMPYKRSRKAIVDGEAADVGSAVGAAAAAKIDVAIEGAAASVAASAAKI